MDVGKYSYIMYSFMKGTSPVNYSCSFTYTTVYPGEYIYCDSTSDHLGEIVIGYCALCRPIIRQDTIGAGWGEITSGKFFK